MLTVEVNSWHRSPAPNGVQILQEAAPNVGSSRLVAPNEDKGHTCIEVVAQGAATGVVGASYCTNAVALALTLRITGLTNEVVAIVVRVGKVAIGCRKESKIW